MIYKVVLSTDRDEPKFWYVTEANEYKENLYEVIPSEFLWDDPLNSWGPAYIVPSVTIFVSDSTPISALSQAIMVTGAKNDLSGRNIDRSGV
jgi:hypothetical protein